MSYDIRTRLSTDWCCTIGGCRTFTTLHVSPLNIPPGYHLKVEKAISKNTSGGRVMLEVIRNKSHIYVYMQPPPRGGVDNAVTGGDVH